ncbi:putative MFS family arabinose efflux permease [Murinocardiopsis flavida]|uniref:Putative MFS family arabinose efflux permease n=1 Tax=Murinocardiopsis flavida TaxID=645275 RepID=A0A2P8CWR7_9ACTN|nr:MFS transporter [Murinocardiopsis flavida]PSK89389.1 putative MFS family arabinose efflux permease [Murinocardiopsis flavida]
MIRRIWPLSLATASLGIDAYVLAGVLPDIAGSLTTTAAVIGLGVTAFTAAYALAGPFLSGPLARGSTKRALVIALLLFNAGNLATAVAPEVATFLGSRVVAGAGAGILTAVATATASGLVAPDRRGRAMSLVTFGLSTGTVLGVPLGMLIGQAAGWRWTMALVVAIGTVSMLAVLLDSRPYPRIAVAHAGRDLRLPARPAAALGVAAALLLGIASLGLYTYLLPIAADAGLGAWSFAFVWTWGIGGVLGSAAVGRPVDVYGSHRVLPAVLAVLALVLAGLWAATNPWAWFVLLALWGACGWASVPALQHLLTRAAPESALPIVAFQMAAMYLGSSVGAALGSAALGAGMAAAALPACAAVIAAAGLGLAVLAVRRADGGNDGSTAEPAPAATAV